MNHWIRVARAAGSALFLAGLLAGCGGGGSGHINVFFGINGSGDCNGVLLDIDLHGANAALSDPIDDCVLDSLLLEGCEVRFWKIERGDVLRVTVSDCEIPATSSLFQCGFDDIDLTRLASNVEARCLCQTQNCDSTPPVCADLDPDPGSCEDCDNGFDDDGNFLTDCDDPNCQYADACDDGSTTTTTTTTLPGATLWSVVFRLAANVSVGSLQFEVDYGSTGGSLLGQGPDVECRSLIDGALIAFNDDDAQQTLTIGLISIAGFTGPIDAVECQILAAEKPTAADFVFSNVELSSPDSEPIPASPSSMAVGAIEFVSGVSTTTTTIGEPTTTSTTIFDDTTTTTEPPTTTTTTTTTTTLPSSNYAVQFSVTATSTGAIGALQWATDYSAATGGFQGNGGAVACTSPISGLFAPNDVDATKQLTLGVISFTGFAAPTTLATCTFNGDSQDPPVPGDFVITLQDATDVDGAPITATIAVTTITPIP